MKPEIPPHWFLEAVHRFNTALYQHTGCKTLARISLDSEMGYRLGLAPGTSMDIHTAAGPVEVYSERMPRLQGTFSLD